jgi:phage/plasmid-like protein (TIGR03299 family)
MSGYRHSPLADEAPGVVETVTPWDGHTMGGRVPAFIGLAQRTGGVFLETVPDGQATPTVAERLTQVGLDYEVTLEDIKVSVPGMNADGEFEVREETMPRHKATVGRYPDGRIVPFGPVGTRYTPIQNMTVANLGQTVVDGGDGSLVAIGAYGDPIGSHVYMAFDLGDFTVGGSDRHKLALTLDTAHDGSGGLTASADPTRVACTNACSGMFGRRQRGSYTIRHTESSQGRTQEIREALGLVWKYVEKYQDESETLLREGMTEREFLAFEHELFGVPALVDATERQRTMIANRDETLLNIWRGDTSEFGRATRWAAAQSVYEFLDWNSIVRGRDPEFARWERTLSGETRDSKARTWNLLLTA